MLLLLDVLKPFDLFCPYVDLCLCMQLGRPQKILKWYGLWYFIANEIKYSQYYMFKLYSNYSYTHIQNIQAYREKWFFFIISLMYTLYMGWNKQALAFIFTFIRKIEEVLRVINLHFVICGQIKNDSF